MRCAQLWATRFDHQKVMQMTGQRDRQTDGQTDGHISLTGPHWGPPDPRWVINAS